MRINLRFKFKGYTFFLMLAQTQKLIGITSKVVNDKLKRHYVFWDLEKCSLAEAEATLRSIQKDYDLGTIFIVSDFPKSFRAWCFTKVDFNTLLHILLETEFVDYNFFYWTVSRGKATLRISNKQNRPEQKIVSILCSPEDYQEEWQQLEEKRQKEQNILSQLERVDYETGTKKIGIFKEINFDR
jgi:hypothetical protein